MTIRRNPRFLRTAALITGLLASTTLAAAQTPASSAQKSAPDDNGWRTVIYPVYGWLPIYGADVKLPPQPSPPGTGGGGEVPLPPIETSNNFNGAAAAGFRLERGRISVEGEVLWAGMSGSVEAPFLKLGVDTIYGQVMGGFELAPALYVTGGGRHFGLNFSASIRDLPEVDWKPGFWEPVIGVTYRPEIGRSLRLMTRADVGSLGSDDRRTSTVTALIEWKPVSHLVLGAGWGVMYLRLDGTILSKPVHLQQTLNGPMLTLGIPF